MSDDNSQVPAGRLNRLARLANLTARTASTLAADRVRRAMGGEDDGEAAKKAAAKMLETLGTMKGAAMKLGQQLAMEVDALPPEARAIVSKLFAQAPAMSFDDVVRVIVEEFGEPPEQVFARLDPAPLASASLGQVHRAQLPDGTGVAVKVQYPGVADALINDLKNAGLLVRAFGGAGKSLANVDPKPYYEEIQREIGAEADYVRESRNAEAFTRSLASVEGVRVPRVHPAFSTKRVLTTDFVEGVSLQVFAESDATNEERALVAERLARAVLLPFLKDGLIHADPHPGNFLVQGDGTVAVLDFGAVKYFTPPFVEGFTRILSAAVQGDRIDLVEVLSEAGFHVTGDVDRARAMLQGIHDIASRPLVVDEYDWGACRMVLDLRQKYAGAFRDMLAIQAPPESLLFYRAIGGLANNLKAMKVRAPSRRTCLEMLAEAHSASTPPQT